jgi:copper chaperone CopZ
VGKEALEGLKGIKKIGKGFRYLREINTVYYDPEIITIDKMEKALKNAGTYVKTIK